MTTLTIYHEGEQPVTLHLAEGDYVIGRGERCRIRLANPAVSERHAILSVRAEDVWIEDLDSSNGTYLNAQPVGRRVRVDAPVTIGPYLLVVGQQAADEKEFAVRSSQFEVEKAAPASEPASANCEPPTANRELQTANCEPRTPEAAIPPPPDPLAAQRRSIKQQIHREVVERLDLKRLSASRIGGEELRERAMETIQQIVQEVEGRLPAGIEPNALAREIYNEALLLGPLEDLLADDTVTEVMVNGPDRIYVERGGRLQLTGTTFMDEASVMAIIERIVSPLGRRIDESQPYVDARLADGSRVNAIIHPLSLIGPCITIRKFSKRPLYDHDLIRFGTLTPEMARFLQVCVLMRKNIIVSGGTGSGKTTLLNVIGNYLPPDERILTIEDAAELRLQQPHLVRLEARPPNIEGKGAITIRDLVRNALRMRPDRIIVGECRGGEALDMLQAMNTGHDGSLTTVHANAPRDVISRLETMVLMSGLDLPSRAIREQIASAVDIIVHESRLSDGSRKVVCISEVVGQEGDKVTMQDLFEFRQTGLSPQGKVLGRFRPTGSVPTFLEDLRARGISLDTSMFMPRD